MAEDNSSCLRTILGVPQSELELQLVQGHSAIRSGLGERNSRTTLRGGRQLHHADNYLKSPQSASETFLTSLTAAVMHFDTLYGQKSPTARL